MPKITTHAGPSIGPDNNEQTDAPEPTIDDHDPLEPVNDSESVGSRLEAEGSAVIEPADKPPVDKGIETVKTWVDNDWLKAERALAAEKAQPSPRSSLVSWLEKIAATKP